MIILLFLALASTVASQTPRQINIRTGISQLQMGSAASANYNVIFNQQLPDTAYNFMVSVSYSTALDTSTGIVVYSACPNKTQTNMGCSVTANNNNQNNIVYMSYVASGVGSLLNLFNKAFSFTTTTSISQALTFKPAVDSKYINNSNALYINFYPMVAGISTLDPDFSLTIDSKRFDALSLEITLNVTIKQMHAKNVTITFGYLLYDANVITASIYPGQRLTPDNVADGYIYGIASIIAKAAPRRMLQIVPNPRPVNPTIPQTLSTKPKPLFINATNAATVMPTIRKRSANQTSSLSAKIPSTPTIAPSTLSNPSAKTTIVASTGPQQNPAAIIPPRQSSVAQAIRTNASQVILVPKAMNSTVFEAVAQPDGVIDANSSAINILQVWGLYPPENTKRSGLAGIDNQLFNSLFSTNGFVILTTADDIDQVYYYDVNPTQPTVRSSQTGASAVYFESTVSSVQPISSCPVGVLVGSVQKVDYVQEKMVVSCTSCPKGMYLDLKRRICEAFPVIVNFLNQVDPTP